RQHDWIRHIYCIRRHCTEYRIGRVDDGCLDNKRLHDTYSCIKLWRTECYVSESRRAVCIPPRGLQPTGKLRVWMDLFRRDTDGDHRCGGRSVRQIYSLPVPYTR